MAILRGRGNTEGPWLYCGDVAILRGRGYTEGTWLY